MSGFFERMLTGLAAGAIAPASVQPSDQSGLSNYCRAVVRRKQAQISDLVSSGRTRIARRKQNELLRCLPARLIAAQQAIRKINRRNLQPANPSNAIPFAQFWQLAQRLKRHISLPSDALARLKPKNDGTLREVCMFDLFDIARQKLIAMSIIPFARLHHSQYALIGGRSAACEALLEALNNAPNGAKFMHVDVTDYYGSIDQDWLEENLPLSADIIQTVVLMTNGHICRWHLGLVHRHDEGTEEMDWPRIRKGIPQGSAVSPIVAEFVIANVLRNTADLFEGLSFFNYSDNLGILMPENMDDAVFMEHLRDVFRAHQAGPFQLQN